MRERWPGKRVVCENRALYWVKADFTIRVTMNPKF